MTLKETILNLKNKGLSTKEAIEQIIEEHVNVDCQENRYGKITATFYNELNEVIYVIDTCETDNTEEILELFYDSVYEHFECRWLQENM